MKQPIIYEINTPIFLNEISQRVGYPVTFANVPDEIWDEVARHGQDVVWFMGVWTRSVVGREMALGNPEFKEVLPDIQDADIIGSAYSIKKYEVEEVYGGDSGLAVARAKLKERGVGLYLDYVPNHVGIDHPWASEHAGYFIHGTDEELTKKPDAFMNTPIGVLAKGKDPTFPPWSDVIQLNAFSVELRQEVSDLLVRISGMCDGVRCDMAMLFLNDVFHKTWGERAGEVPVDEYWPAIIATVKQQNPNFIFLAEVYWGMEKTLLEQGFDFCYDKELYDGLIDSDMYQIKKVLKREPSLQQHLMRFIENHDEPRAAHEFSFEQQQAAAAIASTLPGMHLLHDGEFEGRKVKVPVHLGRRPDETVNTEVQAFYAALVGLMASIDKTQMAWELLETRTGFFHHESKRIVVWAWQSQQVSKLFAVNYCDRQAHAGLPHVQDKKIIRQTDVYGNDVSVVDGTLVTLAPWQVAVIEVA